MSINLQTIFWFLPITTLLSIYFDIPPVNGRIESEQQQQQQLFDYYYRGPIRNLPTPDNKQLCGHHLRYAIATMCRTRGFLEDSHATNVDISYATNSNDADSTNQPNSTGSQPTGHQPDDQAHPGKQLGIITEGHTVLRRLPRQVVDECCDKPCMKEALLKYCNLFKQKQSMQPNAESGTQSFHGSMHFETSTDSTRFLTKSNQRQIREGQFRPWKTMRRHKNKALTILDSNIRNPRENRRTNQFAILSFIVKLPSHPRQRNHKKHLRRIPPLAKDQVGINNEATNSLTKIASNVGLDTLINLLPMPASMLREAHVMSSLPHSMHSWSQPSLFPRLLKTRDTHQVPYPYRQNARGSYVSEGPQVRRSPDSIYFRQASTPHDNEEDDPHAMTGNEATNAEPENHHSHHHHFQSADTQQQFTADTPETVTTTEAGATTKHNVYVFPIGIYDDEYGHGHRRH